MDNLIKYKERDAKEHNIHECINAY